MDSTETCLLIAGFVIGWLFGHLLGKIIRARHDALQHEGYLRLLASLEKTTQRKKK